MEKILLISPVIPDANGGGREKRAHQWVHKLSKQYEVSILIIKEKELEVEEKELLLNGVNNINFVKIPSRSKFMLVNQDIKKLLALKFGCFPLFRETKNQLEEIYREQQFDLILCFRLYLKEYALFLKKIMNTKIIHLDIDDIESTTRLKIAKLFLKKSQYKKAIIHFISSLFFKVEEKRLVTYTKHVYVCSNEDQAVLSKQYPSLCVEKVPNRLYGSPKILGNSGNPFQLLFVGTLSYFPNEEAVLWFIYKVLPRLRKLDSRWVLHVVGYGASERLKKALLKQKGVIFYGYISSLETVYNEAAIVISPLHAGGGTKLKVMEAMWYGRPIVATNESVHGLGLTPYVHFLPAETADEFILACHQLTQEPILVKKLVNASLSMMNEEYTYV